MRLRPSGVVLAWLLSLLACVGVISQTRFVADLSAFLPQLPTARQQLLADQLRDGIVARLIMVGIEGGDSAQRARLSEQLARALRADDAFLGVQNGDTDTQDRDRAFFFDNRYLLSPAVTPERFGAEGLHQAVSDSLMGLAGNGGLLLKSLFARDPTGETLALLEQFEGGSQPASRDGVWASRDGRRAILLLQTRAAGSDIDAQSAAIDRIRAAFGQLPDRPADATLLMSGTSVFSVGTRATIEREVSRLAGASLVLVVALLLAVYRSVRLLLLGLLPVLTGALVGVASVSLGFGQVHGLTLGFGTTLIGEAVDYSIYLFIQRAGQDDPTAFWRTLRLGVLTSVAGFAALLFSGFPGLAQLGLYSISGLVSAAIVTRYVLPVLMPEQLRLRDLTRLADRVGGALARTARLRALVPALLLACVAVLAWQHDRIWNRQLSALSPISVAEQKLDASLRADLGAPDMRYIASVSAKDTQGALQQAERAGEVLRQLVREGQLGGFTSPASVLPSLALQRSRQAALPPPEQAAQRLQQALAGMPVNAQRLQGFLQDLEASRQRPPLERRDLQGSSAAMLADSLLVKREHDVLALLPLQAPADANGELDVERVVAALARAQVPGVTVIDLLAETTAIFDHYLHEALLMSGLGALAVLALLLASLRSLRRTARVALPLAGAVLCVAAGLLLVGQQLTILHLVGLLLVAAIGSNYALFFDTGAPGGQAGVSRQTLVSLLVANLSTVGSFGILGLSHVHVLSVIGGTVAPGAALALLFSAMLGARTGRPDAA